MITDSCYFFSSPWVSIYSSTIGDFLDPNIRVIRGPTCILYNLYIFQWILSWMIDSLCVLRDLSSDVLELTTDQLINSSRAHFTNNFSITIKMWWEFHFALTQILIQLSLQNFAHSTTAQHRQNFVATWSHLNCDGKTVYHTRPIVSRGWESCLWIALGGFMFCNEYS